MEPIRPPVVLLPVDDVLGFGGLPGWTVHQGFDLGAEPWDRSSSRVLCVGVVADEPAATAAMSAVARGAGLALAVTLTGSTRHRFLEDLHKVGEPVAYEPPGDEGIARLEPIQRDLLEALARGATVTAAAEMLHVSRRTANRLLADARTQLDEASTAGAVRRWVAARPDS